MPESLVLYIVREKWARMGKRHFWEGGGIMQSSCFRTVYGDFLYFSEM